MNVFHPSKLWQDFTAGLTGAVAGAPQAMAFALIAGVSPVYGLYTAFTATLVGALTTSSVFLTVAPTNALSLIVGTTLLRFPSEDPLGIIFTLTLLMGLFQILFGLLRLGALTRFVSNAVMTGFLAGSGVQILLGQLPELTGYEPKVGGRLIFQAFDLLRHIHDFDPLTTALGLLSIGLIYGLHHTRAKNLASLSAIILVSGLVALFGWEEVALVRDMSDVPQGLPLPHLQGLTQVQELWSVALALAVLGLVQSAGIAQNFPNPDGRPGNLSRDFWGQGLANVVGAFFQNLPAGGSVSRTAVNLSAGAVSRWANLLAALFTLLILLILGGLIERIALTALAGHLIIASWSLIDVKRARQVWQTGTTPRIAMGGTFAAALLLPLEYSIYIGVGLSLVMYIYTSAANLRVVQLDPLPDGHFRELPAPKTVPSAAPLILGVYGNLYFAAVSTLERQLPDPQAAETPVVILRLRGNEYLGSTGIRLLERYAAQLEQRGGKLMISGIGENIVGQLQRTGAWRRLGGAENIFPETDILLAATEKAYSCACAWLAKQRRALDAAEV